MGQTLNSIRESLSRLRKLTTQLDKSGKLGDDLNHILEGLLAIENEIDGRHKARMREAADLIHLDALDKKNNDYLLLKWGTLKGYCFQNSPEAFEALKEYSSLGYSVSAMMQRDTPRQKELLCIMIDKVNGPITLDWEGIDCTDDRQRAKDYVMEYGKK